MDRREFISNIARLSLSVGFFGAFPLSKVFAKEQSPNPGMWVIDAHAHPVCFHRLTPDPDTHNSAMMRESGIVATSFAAVGDYVFNFDPNGSAYEDTLRQLRRVQYFEDNGYIKIVGRPQEIAHRFDFDAPMSAIVSIEGGDALEGDLDHLDEFYEMGVRMITLVHNNNNEIGNDMRVYGSNDPNDTGLTDFGYQVVERMNELGMVIDVAHASTQTLFDVAEVTKAPIIDSHTNPLPSFVTERLAPSRWRIYSEMEAVVKTGGVVCTWPLAYHNAFTRLTFADWAQEIKAFNEHFGSNHIGLGTDGGGGLPAFVQGWQDVSNLDLLIEEMVAADFNHREIAAFLGENILRTMHDCFVVSEIFKGKSI